MAEDEMSSLNGSEDEDDSNDKRKENVCSSPRPAKKRSKKSPLSTSRSFDGDDEQSGAGRASDDESEEDIPIHANDAARRSSHESASRQEQESTKNNEGGSPIHSPLPKKKKKKKIKMQPRSIESIDEEETKASTEDDSTNPVQKKKKKKRAPGVVSKPTQEVLSWVRSMSVNKQRRHVKVGHRIKVQFATGTKKNGNRRLRWFGGEILEVLPNAKKIKVRYDDGTVEACEFPDNDIIVDADDNGAHTEEAGGNDPSRNPFFPQPASKDNMDVEGTPDPPCDEEVESTSEKDIMAENNETENNSKRSVGDQRTDRADEEGVKKPKKKKRKKPKVPLEESLRDETNRTEKCPQEPLFSKQYEGPSLSPTFTQDGMSYEPTTPSDLPSTKKKKKKGSKLRLKLSASKEANSATSSLVPASSSNDESGNQESDDNQRIERATVKPAEEVPKSMPAQSDQMEALDRNFATSDTMSHSAEAASAGRVSPSVRMVSTESTKVESSKKCGIVSMLAASSPSPSPKPRIKIGFPDSSGKSILEKAPSTPRLQIDLKRVLSPSGKKRPSPETSKNTKDQVSDSGNPEANRGEFTPRPDLPFDTTTKAQKDQSTCIAQTEDIKTKSSPSGDFPACKKAKTVSKSELGALECMSPRGQHEPQTPILTPGSLADAVKLGRHRKPHTSDQKLKELMSPSSATKPKKRRRRVEEESAGIAESPGQDSINTTGDENWVQCDACQKWRLLPDSVDMDTLPERWYCELNKYDKKRMTCTAPEQTAADVMRERIAKLTPRKRRKKLTTPKTEKGSPLEVPLLQGEAGASPSPGHRSSAASELGLPMLPLSASKSEDTNESKVDAGAEGDATPEQQDPSIVSPIPSTARSTAKPSLQPRANNDSKQADFDATMNCDALPVAKDSSSVKDNPSLQKQPKRPLSGCSMKSKSSKADDDTATESNNSRDESAAVAPRDKAKRRHRKKEKIDREAALERSRDSAVKPSSDNVPERTSVPTKVKKEGVADSSGPNKTPMKANDSQEWVQCEKCLKWRRLPPSIKAEDLGDEWYCTLNTWDIRVATCAAPEDFATIADAKASGASRENPNDIFGNEKSASGKVSYRNLIFGTAGRRQTRPTSERARAADSLFISPPNEDAGEIHPTVQYANSSCFVQRSIRTKPEELDTGFALLELMSGTRIWKDLWQQTSSQSRPITSSPRTTNESREPPLRSYQGLQAAPDAVASNGTGNHVHSSSNVSSTSPSPVAGNGNSPEAINESMKALVYHAMGTHHANALTRHEILLEVQCRNWDIPESTTSNSNGSSVSWASLRSACTLEWVDYCLSELVKEGVVQRLAPLDGTNGASTSNDGGITTASNATNGSNGCSSNSNYSGSNNHSSSKGVRYRKISPPNRSSNHHGASSVNGVGHPTRCVKLAKPWKSIDQEKLKQCHWTDTQECEALLQEQQNIFNRQRYDHLYETLGPDPTSSLVSSESASFSNS
jgi:hypothetical protein